MRIIVATHNEGKLVEINRILEDCLGVDADQVELVDIEPDELLERLKRGKIYHKTAAQKAMHNFFVRDSYNARLELSPG